MWRETSRTAAKVTTAASPAVLANLYYNWRRALSRCYLKTRWFGLECCWLLSQIMGLLTGHVISHSLGDYARDISEKKRDFCAKLASTKRLQ